MRFPLPPSSYRDEWRDQFTSTYALNDRAHREDHFCDVEGHARYINETLALGIPEDMIIAAAWSHDMFAWQREEHHLLAADWVRTTDCTLLERFTLEERLQIAEACASHRASFQGAYSHTFAELIAAADRGVPDLRHDLQRAIHYSRDHLKLDEEVGLRRAINHLDEKFGRHGYVRYPPLYRRLYGESLRHHWDLLDELTTMSNQEVRDWLAHLP